MPPSERPWVTDLRPLKLKMPEPSNSEGLEAEKEPAQLLPLRSWSIVYCGGMPCSDPIGGNCQKVVDDELLQSKSHNSDRPELEPL